DGIRDFHVTGVQTCALPISLRRVSKISQPKRCVTSSCSTTTRCPSTPTSVGALWSSAHRGSTRPPCPAGNASRFQSVPTDPCGPQGAKASSTSRGARRDTRVGTHPDLVRNVYSISTVCRWNQKLDGATPGRG